MNHKIDFVLPWVDGNDRQWKERFQQYSSETNGDKREIRFRSWDLLHYWFRGVEQFAPWVGDIYFITSGELPSWLNIEHPKLKWLKHEDYIPNDYLPTFCANTIELNLHRIQNLSDKFIYFNDDCFLTKSVKPSRFFQNNLPCDLGVMTAKPASGGVIHLAINDLEVIEAHFNKHKVMNKHLCKWFNFKYGTKILNNILLYPWTEFSGFIDPHMPNAFLKETFNKVWEAEPNVLDATCKTKFRTNNDVNQWLIRYWQLAEGKFTPYNIKKRSLCLDINDQTIEKICNTIETHSYEMICINDSGEISDFELMKTMIQNSFEKILPKKSSFEL